ncbi:MAG TPA: ATP-binding protein [Vicinamibacteria bacterium]|nr:ATP-binding protein [Vicinamibacteria bacterium]
MATASLELVRGSLDERVFLLAPRDYSVGRAANNDLALPEPSVSKSHARITCEDGQFWIEDLKSLHGVYVNAAKVQKAALTAGTQLQLGNLTFTFSLLTGEGTTDRIVEFPWAEQQQLVLQLVQTLNATLVLSEVLEQVLDGVMRITRAERGFLLLSESSGEAGDYPSIAGLRLRVGRRRGGEALTAVQGLSSSVIRKAIESGETVATGNAVADPALGQARSVILMDLRTIVCIPLRSPRSEAAGGAHRALGALYVDNPETSAAFPPDGLRAAEALARHAALAIENAQLFEREQRTIEELRRAQQRLLQAEKLATIGKMAAGIAHELNTPLTYIMGNLEMLRMRGQPEEQQEMLESVDRGVERIRSLAQSLLAFSRPSDEEPAPLDVNTVVERALEFCHYQVLKAGLRVEKRLASDLPSIQGVASQLEMAFINLIVNAAHAMAGLPARDLVVTTRRAGGDVQVVVADTGPGIPESIRASLFEPFVTTKAEGEGTGLGLSTVLMIVERHRGRIAFTSEVGSGTTFEISLPIA